MVIDENGECVENPDLELGYLATDTIIKPDAEPIDNVTKFAWDSDDYETVTRYIRYTEEELEGQRREEFEKQKEYQINVAAELFVQTNAQQLSDDQAFSVSALFLEWDSANSYKVGEIRRYNGSIYRCIQAHDGQETWNPKDAVSLWARITEPGTIPEWEQPRNEAPFMKGDKVSHNGNVWVSNIDNNVWEPGVYGWSVVE